jgi:hypothetical protein
MLLEISAIIEINANLILKVTTVKLGDDYPDDSLKTSLPHEFPQVC